MKIRLVKKKTIEIYTLQNARSKPSFQLWLGMIKYADWNTPGDIMGTFGTADILGNGCNRVVFNVGGNNYRMICGYSFSGMTKVHLYIKWIGTHAEYSELCNRNLQYNINSY